MINTTKSKEISKSFSHCKDARTWLELYKRFGQTNTVQLFHIENAIQGSSSVTSFFTQLKSLWDEKEALCNFPGCVCDAGNELKSYIETQKIMKFLMGLNDEFATTRSNIIGMDPLPSLNKAYSMALRHEKQAVVSANKAVLHPSESTAFYAQQQCGNLTPSEPLAACHTTHQSDLAACAQEPLPEPFTGHVHKTVRSSSNYDGKRRCEKCDRTNHSTENCKAHLRCTICNWKGHTSETCR
ncbi:hypothetical protein ACLB2K_046915 [Fragaria x ananassa]